MRELRLIPIEDLRVHEEVDETQVERVMTSMRETGKFSPPLLVDVTTGIILDGHHRYWACRRLGCKRVPCYCVDYLHDEDIVLKSWRPGVGVTKEQVVTMGMSDGIFPQKTTRHIYEMPDFEPIPMDELY